MSAFSKCKSGALAAALLLSFAVMMPPAHAHNCHGRNTIETRYSYTNASGRLVYLYIQSGRVCGTFVA